MNTKQIINQKSQSFWPAAGAADWGQLQHIKTFMGLSGRRCGKDEVLRLIDTRQIRWAWDIARKGARRPEVRIWRESLIACLAEESGAGAIPLADGLSLSQVIETILPTPAALTARGSVLRSVELQRRFLCCRGHIAGLIADGELCRVGPPGENPAVLCQSVREFLKRRSMSI
jgi:hypothetical protein